MKHFAKLAACLIAILCRALAPAQTSTQDGAAVQNTTSTSAYVYVITAPTNKSYELDGYSAASDGTLTLLPGSPFWTSNTNFVVTGLANTAHWLFLSDGTYIYSFSISSTGTLKQVSSINAFQFYGEPGGEAGGYLVLDHTGSTLYALAQDGTGDNEIQFFDKNSTTGALTYFGNTGLNTGYGYLAFSANNQYAYNFACYGEGGSDVGGIRSSNGALTGLFPTYQVPTYSGGSYCLNAVAADPFGNLAVAMYPTPFNTGAPGLPPALGLYTIDSSGNLSTNSTAENMPTTEVGWMNQNNLDMAASPAGNLLAVSGENGLQIFFFNGSKQITPYTGFLAEHPITQVEWDNHNHLYGISSSGRLYSFTVTTTGYNQNPGSPYTVNGPRAITVLSK